MGLPPKLAVTSCRRGTHDCDDIVETPMETEPPEDIENNGCPGGWYRSPWVESVINPATGYRRRPAEGSQRVPNPRLDRCDDDVVIEAVTCLEQWEDDWTGEHLHQIRKSRKQE